MPRANQKASYIDVTLHQAARRDALANGLIPADDEPGMLKQVQQWKASDASLKSLLWTLFTVMLALIAVLAYIKP